MKNRGEIYAGGRHLATYVNSTTYFAHGDWLGTERARTNVSGDISETCQGLPFGDGLSCSGSDISPLHFTGKQHDSETGLDYPAEASGTFGFGARYDSSSVGRFMTPDWSAKVEPVPYAKLGDPQSLDLYVYSADNPLTNLDPTGHTWKQVMQDLKTIARNFNAQVSLGVGFALKGSLGPYSAGVDAVEKGDLGFSSKSGNVYLQTGPEVSAEVGVGKLHYGGSLSKPQRWVSFNVRTEKFHGPTPATPRLSKGEYSLGELEGLGIVNGGRAGLSEEGTSALKRLLPDVEKTVRQELSGGEVARGEAADRNGQPMHRPQRLRAISS